MPAYTWDQIPDEPVRPGVRRRAFGTGDVMLVLNHCEPGMDVRPHSHDFDQIAMITKGRAIYHIGDETVENIDVFAPAREDYLHLLEWLPSA